MAISRMASQDHDAVITYEECPWNEYRINSSGTHHPDDPCIGRILKSGNTCEIRPRIGTPVTQEG
jgi:hypothetical protein